MHFARGWSVTPVSVIPTTSPFVFPTDSDGCIVVYDPPTAPRASSVGSGKALAASVHVQVRRAPGGGGVASRTTKASRDARTSHGNNSATADFYEIYPCRQRDHVTFIPARRRRQRTLRSEGMYIDFLQRSYTSHMYVDLDRTSHLTVETLHVQATVHLPWYT